MVQSMTLNRGVSGELAGHPNYATLDPSQTMWKSRHMTMPRQINSMERILDWKPKELHRLNMINEKKNIFMERSLGNTIPYKQGDIGKIG